MKVGAINADEHKDLGGRYGVRGFPTIKIFSSDKNKPIDFDGQRTAQGLTDAILSEIKNKVKAQLGGKSSHSKSYSGVVL